MSLENSLNASSSSICTPFSQSPAFSCSSCIIKTQINSENLRLYGSILFSNVVFEYQYSEIGLHMHNATEIVSIKSNLKELAWRKSNMLTVDVDIVITENFRETKESILTDEPSLWIKVEEPFSEFAIEWSLSLEYFDFDRHTKDCRLIKNWFPCHHLLLTEWTLSVLLEPNFLYNGKVFSSIPIHAVNNCEYTFSGSDRLRAKEIAVITSRALEIPLLDYNLKRLWVHPLYCKLSGTIQEYIEKTIGLFLWFFNIDSFRSTPSIVFIRQFKVFVAGDLIVLPAELLSNDKELEVQMSFRRFWVYVLCKWGFRCYEDSDPNVVEALHLLLAYSFLKVFYGENFYRATIFDLVQEIHSSFSKQTILIASSFDESNLFNSHDFFASKPAKICIILDAIGEKMSPKSNLRALFSRLYHFYDSKRSISSRTILESVYKLCSLDLRNFWDNLSKVSEDNLNKTITYVFDRKRMEMEIQMSGRNSEESQSNIVLKSLTIRLQEHNGNIYDHVIKTNNWHCSTTLPIHSRLKRFKNKKRKNDEAVDEKADPTKDNTEEIEELPPVKWTRADPTNDYPFTIFEIIQKDIMLAVQLLKDSSADPKVQLRTLELLHQSSKRKPDVEEAVLEILERIINDNRLFWRVRCKAVEVLCDVGPNATKYALKAFSKRFCIHEASEVGAFPPIRPNNFSSVSDYFVQKSFARHLSLCIATAEDLSFYHSSHEASFQNVQDSYKADLLRRATSITQALIDMLRHNDNNSMSNCYNDGIWISELFKGLSGCLNRIIALVDHFGSVNVSYSGSNSSFETLFSSEMKANPTTKNRYDAGQLIVNILQGAFEQSLRYINREHMFPSYQNVILQSILKGPIESLLASSVIIEGSDIVKNLLLSSQQKLYEILLNYTSENNFWQVKISAIDALSIFAAQLVGKRERRGVEIFMKILELIRQSKTRLVRQRLIMIIKDALNRSFDKLIDTNFKAAFLSFLKFLFQYDQNAFQIFADEACCLWPQNRREIKVPPLKLLLNDTDQARQEARHETREGTVEKRNAVPPLRIQINVSQPSISSSFDPIRINTSSIRIKLKTDQTM